ncbi:MAG: SMI1/KNR4 family protein [Bacteroidales bacterium]|nr:SMI1/KNR4 family protein [Bacteroidales bacterium]
MSTIIEQLKSLIINKQDELLAHLNFGACSASINAFKSKLGLELPETFYSFYELFNGSVSINTHIWGPMSLLPLSGIIDKKQLLDKHNAQGNFSDWKPGNWWNPNWVPFLSDNTNTLLCVDTIGIFGGLKGQIFQWRNDSPSRIILSETFDSWLVALFHLINNFSGNIAMEQVAYYKYCSNVIDKITNDINQVYPKFTSVARLSGT